MSHCKTKKCQECLLLAALINAASSSPQQSRLLTKTRQQLIREINPSLRLSSSTVIPQRRRLAAAQPGAMSADDAKQKCKEAIDFVKTGLTNIYMSIRKVIWPTDEQKAKQKFFDETEDLRRRRWIELQRVKAELTWRQLFT